MVSLSLFWTLSGTVSMVKCACRQGRKRTEQNRSLPGYSSLLQISSRKEENVFVLFIRLIWNSHEQSTGRITYAPSKTKRCLKQCANSKPEYPKKKPIDFPSRTHAYNLITRVRIYIYIVDDNVTNQTPKLTSTSEKNEGVFPGTPVCRVKLVVAKKKTFSFFFFHPIDLKFTWTEELVV